MNNSEIADFFSPHAEFRTRNFSEDSHMSLYYSINDDTLDKTLEAGDNSEASVVFSQNITNLQSIQIADKAENSSKKFSTPTSLQNAQPISQNSFDHFKNLVRSVEKNKENDFSNLMIPNINHHGRKLFPSHKDKEMKFTPIADVKNMNRVSFIPHLKSEPDLKVQQVPETSVISSTMSAKPEFQKVELKPPTLNVKAAPNNNGVVSKMPKPRNSTVPVVISKNRFSIRKSIVPPIRKVESAASESSTVLQKPSKGRQSIFIKPEPPSVAAATTQKHDCKICKRSFHQKSSLDIHEKTHDKPSNVCTYCDKKFAFPLALKNHMLEHCTAIPLREKQKLLAEERETKLKGQMSSSYDLPRKSSLDIGNRSLKNLHAGVFSVPKKILKCDICEARFLNIFKFQDHKREKSCSVTPTQKNDDKNIVK